MYRGTDDLSKFFAIGTSTIDATRSGNESAQSVVANMQVSSLETNRGEEISQRSPNLTTAPLTVTTENSDSTTTTTNVSPTVGSGGASGVMTTKPAPIAPTTKMQAKTTGMTTKHWIILAVVVVSAFAAYKYFTKKQA